IAGGGQHAPTRFAHPRLRPSPGALEGHRGRADRDRVSDRGRACPPPRPRQVPAAAPRAGIPPRRVRQRADHRLAHQAAARQVRGGRSRVCGDRHGAWAGLPLPRGLSVSWLLRLVSRISVRLLAFNLLLVFLPVAGIYYPDTYERQLLDAQERAMVQEGRVVAAALSERGPLQPREAEGLLMRLRQQSEARLRVVAPDGRILADSSRL